MDTFDSQLREIAVRHGLSTASAAQLADGLLRTQGRQVQFNIPEFGGMGQWMPGMVMAGHIFDTQLKARVDAACTDIARLVREGQIQASPSGPDQNQSAAQSKNWWPGDLGTPAIIGGQNDLRYAWFPGIHRLAINEGGQVSVYDTADHFISGVSQQQSDRGRTLVFTSQHGVVNLSQLKKI